MSIKIYHYVDQKVGTNVITTRFDDLAKARKFAATVGGKVRRPLEARNSNFAGALFQALVDAN